MTEIVVIVCAFVFLFVIGLLTYLSLSVLKAAVNTADRELIDQVEMNDEIKEELKEKVAEEVRKYKIIGEEAEWHKED